MVSAIQPTGQGGVDVGTWAEEEDELESAEHSPLLGGHRFSEPGEVDPDPLEHRRTPVMAETAMLSNPSSPSSPMSPTTRARFRHRGPRYGTLIPDLVHSGAPSGFSIGLGAASPGFVLRPGSMSISRVGERSGSGTYRHMRRRSEGLAGLHGIARDEEDQTGGNRVEEPLRGWERPAEIATTRDGWWMRFRRSGEGRIKVAGEGEGG